MIQINLLPIRVKKRNEGARQFATAYLLTIVLGVSIIGYLWTSYSQRIVAGQNALSSLRQEVKKYAKFDVELKKLAKDKQLVDKKRLIVKNLQSDRDEVVRMLALLSIQVPPGKMWFNKLTEAGNSVTLEGVAQNNEAIVEFMRNLESSPYVQKGSINLALSKQLAVREMKLRHFQLTYRFYPYSEIQKKLKM